MTIYPISVVQRLNFNPKLLPNILSFAYPAVFDNSMIHPLPNNEQVDIMCHHSVGNKNMRSGKNHMTALLLFTNYAHKKCTIFTCTLYMYMNCYFSDSRCQTDHNSSKYSNFIRVNLRILFCLC